MRDKIFAAVFGFLLAANVFAAHRYELRAGDDPAGIDKFYMGRQIARVVSGHGNAVWLERPEREQEEQTTKMVDLLALKPGDVVADVGAGTGYMTWRMARKVAPNGKVYAQDVQQEMLDMIAENMKKRDVTNVVLTLGTASDAKLPANTLDLVLMVDVYHEFDHPYEMAESLVRALKPGGRLVFVEFKKEDPQIPIYPPHKMSEAQVKKEMAVFPLAHAQTFTNLPWQHVIVFKKKPTAPTNGRGSFDLQPSPNVQPLAPGSARIDVENAKANPIPANPQPK
jgi:ubiquinone/menaquinone biosynthesis C-methylase UbiE